ncbi:hypothetical protein NTE_00159 [Candidatus Nitrososphaera evergladensis SR1]|uniref:Uncharacterized protein n=1 Tax=Candidatus Nitrososphaera evergladensis SR1 TaxID=1459636 RepID=A0A075MLE3_9ARCH|nr:hypothetical protein NTE_00159 [Candidatus Nitrososphaera evergladensis SR1]
MMMACARLNQKPPKFLIWQIVQSFCNLMKLHEFFVSSIGLSIYVLRLCLLDRLAKIKGTVECPACPSVIAKCINYCNVPLIVITY